jgi:hypothetical protein
MSNEIKQLSTPESKKIIVLFVLIQFVLFVVSNV